MTLRLQVFMLIFVCGVFFCCKNCHEKIFVLERNSHGWIYSCTCGTCNMQYMQYIAMSDSTETVFSFEIQNSNVKTPESTTLTSFIGRSFIQSTLSIASSVFVPSITCLITKVILIQMSNLDLYWLVYPNATYFVSIQGVACNVTQNCEPFVCRPLFAMPTIPRLSCGMAKFSSTDQNKVVFIRNVISFEFLFTLPSNTRL